MADAGSIDRFLAKARGEQGERAGARVVSLDELRAARAVIGEPWGLPALRGRLVEISARGASATLTAATGIVLEAQHAAEPAAWITLANASFYPPDVAASGVDLSALVVVRVGTVVAAARAAERLLRSGAFGLVVIDWNTTERESQHMPAAVQGRLVTLAQAHDAAVVCLTAKSDDAASLGSLVSLRAAALRSRDHVVTIRALKDKRRGPGWSRERKARGPSGL